MLTTCAICGGTAEVASGTLPEPDGPPDFDTRPAEPLRQTIRQWVAECPHCGYASDDIASASAAAKDIVESAEYRAIAADPAWPPETRKFVCYAYLLDKLHQYADAGWSCLHAAWICDDIAESTAGALCRAQTIELWQKGKRAGQSFGEDLASEFALVTDLYRRTSEFENATVTCAEGLDIDDLPPVLERLLRRQLTLIQARDTEAHNLSELL